MSKGFSILYNGKWLKNVDHSTGNCLNTVGNATRPSTSSMSSIQDKFCCLSREDVLHFLIGCLGALAPLPLSSISTLKAVNPNYSSIEASCPAIDSTKKLPYEPCAVAVVEQTQDGQSRIIGEISSSRLWKCDYLAAAWALAHLSAGQFVMGVEDNMNPRSLSDTAFNEMTAHTDLMNGGEATRSRTFSSKSVGFVSIRPILILELVGACIVVELLL